MSVVVYSGWLDMRMVFGLNGHVDDVNVIFGIIVVAVLAILAILAIWLPRDLVLLKYLKLLLLAPRARRIWSHHILTCQL
jgi:hypothetical protein